MLEMVVERCRSATCTDQVVVLTSTLPDDDAIEAWARSRAIAVFRGEPYDVLDRFASAANAFRPDIVVRVTADCPLLDPSVVDLCVHELVCDPEAEYVATRMPNVRSFPVGIDVEVVRRVGLMKAALESTLPYQREHVTPWFYDGSSAGKTILVEASQDAGDERWTVDTIEDLEFVRCLAPMLRTYSWLDTLNILDNHPELRAINASISQKHYKESQQT